MRIKSKDVWAEQWAMENVDKDDEQGSVARDWQDSKQVYAIDDFLWDLLGTDGMDSVPVAALREAPYQCLYIQHKKVVEDEVLFDRAKVRLRWKVDGYVVDFPSPEDGLHMRIIALMEMGGSYRLFNDERDTSLMQAEKTVKVFDFDLSRSENLQQALEKDFLEDAQKAAEVGSLASIAYPKGVELLGYRGDLVAEGFFRMQKNCFEFDKVLGSLLYITARNADIRTVYEPGQVKKKLARKASQSTIHEVGFQIARDLGEVRRVKATFDRGDDPIEETPSEPLGGEKAKRRVRPHVRKAHWHCYYLGPKNDPTDVEVLWLKPIVVNASRGEVQGKIHLPAKDRADAAAGVGYMAIGDQRARASASMTAGVDSHVPVLESNEPQVGDGASRA